MTDQIVSTSNVVSKSGDTSDLSGLTMIDLAGIGPVARCGRVLADLGARWIQIVAPASAKRIPLPWHAYGALRGAEQVVLDLNNPEDRQSLIDLAADADIVIEGFRPGVADRLGVGYLAMSSNNPALIYSAATGFGQDGPYAQTAGHDLNYQALAGSLATTGRTADGSPALPGLTTGDSAGGGWFAAIRILAALNARHMTGKGCYIDVSTVEGLLHLNALAIDEYLATGHEPQAGNDMLTGGWACYDTYPTGDGGAVAVAAIEPKFFANLCNELGVEHLIGDQTKPESQEKLRAELARLFLRRSRDEWTALLSGKDVCVSPVLYLSEVTKDEHHRQTGSFTQYEHQTHGQVEQLKSFPRSDGMDSRSHSLLSNETRQSSDDLDQQLKLRKAPGAWAGIDALDKQADRLTTEFGSGQKLTWRRWGDSGPNVVLLHGGGGSWTHWHLTIPALLDDHIVWVPDLPGAGDSDLPLGHQTFDSLAGYISSGIEQLLPDEPFDLAGFSFGTHFICPIIHHFALAETNRQVDKAIIVGMNFLEPPKRELNLVNWKRARTEAARNAGIKTNLLEIMLAHEPSVDELVMDMQRSNLANQRLKPRLVGDLKPLINEIPKLPEGVRIFAISGTEDFIAAGVMDQQATALDGLRSGSEFFTVKDSGHWVMHEGAPMFNTVLKQVLHEGDNR